MKKMFGGILGLLVLSAFAIVATDSAQAVDSTGPYYAEPSWDQKLPASTRFVVLSDWNNNAVLDRETGLVWEKSPAATTHIWNQARSQCSSRTTGGRKGWRLPSVHELASLVDPSVAPPGPTLPPGHPFLNLPPGFDLKPYWAASTDAGDPDRALLVEFNAGNIGGAPKSFDIVLARCVRGGQNHGNMY